MDAVLGDAILMVRINATKRYRLVAFGDFLKKSRRLEDAIIGMVVLNGHAAFASILLNSAVSSFFCFFFSLFVKPACAVFTLEVEAEP